MEKEPQLCDMIREKAGEMYFRLGFKGVTLDDIAQEMCISKKTIYQHYANKNELIAAVAGTLMQMIFTEIDTIAGSGYNAIEELFEIRKFLRKTIEDKYQLATFQLKKFFPEVSVKLNNSKFDRMQYCITNNLIKGIAEGLFRKDINIDFVSRIYFTGISGTKDTNIFPDELFSMDALHLLFLEYHLRAICTPEGITLLDNYLKENP
ncbi:TetR/AcrR family transcriptional regulator [Flavobacterium sp. RHBU_24]|uniref:TetR/AcrR family transcriptional regulator n=1 Tax=Flavobacterium sp. RHBU_24 TaxID=3391185 RepID=UPI003984B703